MKYNNTLFSKMNTVIFNNKETKDFFVGFDISNISKTADFFMDYFIESEDNIDLISYKIYGDISYYWTILLVNNIQDALFDLPLNSDEVKNKGIELQNIQNEIIRKHNEMNLIDISSIELPYKVRLGMTELEFEKHLMSLFGNFKKEVQDEISYREK